MDTSSLMPGLTAGTWDIDPVHSQISFSIRHLMTRLRGTFTDFAGEITIGDRLEESSVTAQIQAASVCTHHAERDAHLASAEVLDAANHPVITFQSDYVDTDSGDRHVGGRLTLRGVTCPVVLEVTFLGVSPDPWGRTRAGFCARGDLLRKAWGIDFNIPLAPGELLLGERVTVELHLQAVQARNDPAGKP
jgi:polyisoprenoid-binding protein YceI